MSAQNGNKPVARPTTIKDVAASAGVSTATVSRVLSGAVGAGKAVRERVLRTARDLSYQPNRMARGLRARERKLVGMILPDLQNPFFTGVVHGVEAVLCEQGYTLLLGHSDGLARREYAHLNLLRAESAAGLVLIPGNEAEASYAALGESRIPVVAVDRSPQGLQTDLVKTSNREGARAAVAHLIGLGHRRIALINGPGHLDVARERFEGYRAAHAEAAWPLDECRVIHSDFRRAGGQAAMLQLLHLPDPPQAVFITNNLMTLGALECIHEHGLRIPDDMAVVSYDDMPWATSLQPPLTAVAQPAEELGRAAASLLLERLREPQRLVRQVVLPATLIVRASCGAKPASAVTAA